MSQTIQLPARLIKDLTDYRTRWQALQNEMDQLLAGDDYTTSKAEAIKEQECHLLAEVMGTMNFILENSKEAKA